MFAHPLAASLILGLLALLLFMKGVTFKQKSTRVTFVLCALVCALVARTLLDLPEAQPNYKAPSTTPR
ncbi:MAG: hypothetical protein JWN89_398 [Parcubacteria group bacterium]|nr:hypothetical protein [Parcubacteria group bacterium]